LFLGVATSFDIIVQEIEIFLAITIIITSHHYCRTIATAPIVKTHQ
jgi:hypothetical protein